MLGLKKSSFYSKNAVLELIPTTIPGKSGRKWPIIQAVSKNTAGVAEMKKIERITDCGPRLKFICILQYRKDEKTKLRENQLLSLGCGAQRDPTLPTNYEELRKSIQLQWKREMFENDLKTHFAYSED